MSLTPTRTSNPIRAALREAMLTPKVQAAVVTFVNALVDEGEAILRTRYGGETLRVYTPKHAGREQRQERARRVVALASAPSNLPPARIAADVGLSERRVRQILAHAGLEAGGRKSSA